MCLPVHFGCEDAAAKLAHQKHPFQVHIQGAVPIPFVQFEQGSGGADGCGVDEDVKSANFGAGCFDEVDTLELVGHIGGDGEGAAALVADGLGGSFGPVRVQVIDDNGCPCGREGLERWRGPEVDRPL